MRDPNLDEAMDACRSNSSDLQLPELRHLAARLEVDAEARRVFEHRQELDQRIATDLQRVELSETRRANLRSAARALAEAHADAMAVPSTARRPDVRRRRLTLAALGLVAASIVLMAMLGLQWLNPWRGVGPSQLARWAMQDWKADPRGWQSIAELPVEQRGWISPYLRSAPARWQTLTTVLDKRALVFDLPGNKRPARLFVLRAGRRVKLLPTRPPQQPQTSYEGWLFAAWQERAHVFVFAVDGSTQHYRDLIRTPGHSLARSAGRL